MISRSRRYILLSIGAALTAAIMTLVLQQVGQLREGRNPIAYLRTRYWHDQLGYLSIAVNAREGDLGLSEPVTMTGVNHYPRFYYTAVGVFARVLDLEVVTAWNLLSFTLQFVAVAALALVLISLSGRWWMAVIAPLPFFTGTFAYLTSPDAWFTALESHAVLWGPWGVLFSNNGETAGLSVGIIAISLLAWAWARPRRIWVRLLATVLASAAVGMLSSFQTYSFLTLTYTLASVTAVAALVVARRRGVLLVLTVALLALVFAAGPIVAERVGQLPTLVFGLLPFFPGIIAAIFQSRGLVAAGGVAAAATAAPQLIYTISGILGGDEFLSYRVASNHDLGVASWQAVFGTAVVLAGLIGFGTLGVVVRDAFTTAVTVGGLTSFGLLAVNDVWGANAEPYRFWIDGFLISGVLVVLSAARLFGVIRHRTMRRDTDTDTDTDTDKEKSGTRRALAGVSALVLLLWVAALPDWVNSLRDDYMQAAWDPGASREQAIADLAKEATTSADEGLLTTDQCIDNRTTKLLSGSPVANYHLGMAWPANRDAIDGVLGSRENGELDAAAMTASDTRWVLTDSNCASDWGTKYEDSLVEVGSVDYSASPTVTGTADSSRDGTITLWRFAG